ncbi:MAG: hypothetical protein AABW49_00445 [Nanoarchaeota archaeon]
MDEEYIRLMIPGEMPGDTTTLNVPLTADNILPFIYNGIYAENILLDMLDKKITAETAVDGIERLLAIDGLPNPVVSYLQKIIKRVNNLLPGDEIDRLFYSLAPPYRPSSLQ